MASLNQLVSEIVSAVGQPNNIPLRRNAKYAIIHTRNELIRQSYVNNRYVDKGLMQRIRLSLIDVPEGDLFNSDDIIDVKIKRTKQKVSRPVRFTNNLPFQSVRTVGIQPRMIPFVKESVSQFYGKLPGMCNLPTYDYTNDYIYIIDGNNTIINLGAIIVESVFEHPQIVPIETFETLREMPDDIVDNETEYDDDEFLLPEDMIGPIKDVIFKRNLLNVVRETNEVPIENKVQ